ncbi:MAG: hypothetical protein KDD73_14670 [Anaerolineales bacterium]|nr:hypothetical protein [Anaerolineales bacterium]MCB9129220.1 hypothetical protein [Ardenticatenales bacterium]
MLLWEPPQDEWKATIRLWQGGLCSTTLPHHQYATLREGKVYVKGVAIALGHPLGCTGAKLTANDLRNSAAQRPLVTMCSGGGMAPRALNNLLQQRQQLDLG